MNVACVKLPLALQAALDVEEVKGYIMECPNTCGVTVECSMEQHLSVCPLEPVACEMKEFGCSVVAPRKELARHMRESELQHLTTMTVMNLRLTRQLQQDSTERDRKIAQLQQEMTDQKKQLDHLETKSDAHKRELTEQLTEVKDHLQEVQRTTGNIEHHMSSLHIPRKKCEVCIITQYSQKKKDYRFWSECPTAYSEPFLSHCYGYKFRLGMRYYFNEVSSFLDLMEGEYDDELHWPVEVKVQLKLLNQAGDHDHVVKTNLNTKKWEKADERNGDFVISYFTYSDLERQSDGIQYIVDDCLTFEVHIVTN